MSSVGTPSSPASPDSGFGLSRRSATPPNMDHLSLEDTEAGPDIAYDEPTDAEFRPATEVFKDPTDFDFLSQHGAAKSAAASNLARESLYVKFDPLIAGRQSILPKNDAQKSQMTDLIGMNSPSPKKNLETGESSTPATPIKSAHQSSSSSSEIQENLLKKESQILELQRVLEDKLETVEKHKSDAIKRKEAEEQMSQVLKEYEKTISELIAEKEKEKVKYEEEKVAIKEERDQATVDLHNVESAFADVHRKYERSKQIIENFKQNEVVLKECIEEHKTKLAKQDQKYELLKAHAEETLEKANREIENLTRSQENEITRLSALLKKAEMKVSSLERAVEQKHQENQELTAICDELIAKVGQ